MSEIEMSEVAEKLRASEVAQGVPNSPGLGYERVTTIPGSTYRDNSTIVIVPSRSPMFHHLVVSAWQGLIAPMNQKRAWMFCIGDEVGIAYNNLITQILANPELGKWKYVLTLESDNLPPPDAHVRLLETIERFKFDVVGGLYWTKGDVNMPQAYGDPKEFAQTGVLDFRPRETAEALAAGQVMEVNGTAMGCTLYRMDLFREIPHPWFVTVADMIEGQGPMGFTQDLWFAKNARARGKRFAIDTRVKVGHLDETTGVVY